MLLQSQEEGFLTIIYCLYLQSSIGKMDSKDSMEKKKKMKVFKLKNIISLQYY